MPCRNSELIQLYTKVKEAKDLYDVRSEFDQIYDCFNQRTWHNLFNTFRRNIPPLTEADLEDDHAQAWMNVLIKRDKFKPKKTRNLYSYIFTMMVNLVKNRLIRKSEHEVDFSAVGLLLSDGDDDDTQAKFELMLKNSEHTALTAVIDEASYQVKKRTLEGALESLVPMQSKVFNLRVYDELGFQEIADKFEMAVGNVNRTFKSSIKNIDHYFQSNFNISLEDFLRDSDV